MSPRLGGSAALWQASKMLLYLAWLLYCPSYSLAKGSDLDTSGSLLDAVPPIALSFLERRSLSSRRELNGSLLRRDDYSCGPGNPCSNGACCGASGYCGYGPTYCGSGCVSNCDATAECGQYSSPANKTCPLNTCCSQYGFCGTTRDFCDSKCQSNCVLHPSPPSGSPTDKTLSRVIGYYEAWSARSKCHQTSPTDLPLDALTHLNYAFAFIDSSSFEITTMDAATPVSLFDDIAALKIIKPELQIFVSVGGWTFSDNNTATQPVFGNIARSSSNRQTFANNVLGFLNQYGFDGVDVDWEYPGAPDRGGSKDDTENYVEMLKTLRKTFDSSGRKLGITFTAPSSFWYMRWFDLPGLLKYADWMNFMTYDLHGVWDSTNPIGSIVQGHTNLTEIKLASELLWRVKVPPSKVAMGFGFYGRAFTLQDPSCTTPGCLFSGGANPGVCTATSGYLAYYEIQDILSKNPDIKVIHDQDAAVKYFSWDSNQWISYDDMDTFKQKVDWANSIGFSGSLIWASDLDDYTLTAHKALTGNEDLGKALNLKMAQEQQPLVDDLNDFLGQNCYKFTDVVDLNNPQASSCSPDVRVGYDKAGCSGKDGDCGKPICCPKDSGLKNCQWRGSGGDCNGQCHAGEVNIAGSSWGGTPGESGTNRCGRGGKAFCCQMGLFDDLTDGCYWTSGYGNPCKDNEQSIAHMYDRWGWGSVFANGNDYCCPKSSPMPFTGCHWVGQGDCADNTCDDTEVTLLVDNRGDSYWGCNWYRNKALCCKPNLDALETLTCDADLCTDDPSGCDDEAGYEDSGDGYFTKRSYEDGRGNVMWSYNEPWLVERVVPATPGSARAMTLNIGKLLQTSLYGGLQVTSRPYPPGRKVFSGDGVSTLPLVGAYSMLKDVCDSTAVQFVKLADLPKTGFNAEHLQEIQMIPRFLATAITGYLPSGNVMKAAKLDPQKLLDGWNKAYDVTLPRIGAIVSDVSGWTAPVTPNDRIFEIIGSYAYRTGMSFLPKDMNLVKRDILRQFAPMSMTNFKSYLAQAANGDEVAAKKIAGSLQKTIGVFNYLNDAVLRDWLDVARRDLAREISNADQYMPQLNGILAIWEEFEADFYATAVTFATSFVTTRIGLINQKFPLGGTLSNPAVSKLVYEAAQLSKASSQIRFPE